MFHVARILTKFGHKDYLCGWDRRYGTACSGKPRAIGFKTRDAAEKAAAKARKLVPEFVDGKPIEWVVVPA